VVSLNALPVVGFERGVEPWSACFVRFFGLLYLAALGAVGCLKAQTRAVTQIYAQRLLSQSDFC